MERISLPVRTVTTRAWIAIPVAVGAILLALLWMAHVMVMGFLVPFRFGDFEKVVSTGSDIVRPRASGEPEIWTLFVEAGRMRALAPQAWRASADLDARNGQMKYVYAQAVWRDYNTPISGDRAPSGRLRSELPGLARALIGSAIRLEPMNAFYRQTLVALDIRIGMADVSRNELLSAADNWAPQNSWGQLRAAECMVRLGADRGRILPHYVRAMDLATNDIVSGLTDPLAKPITGVPPDSLGYMEIRQAFDGLVANVGGYDAWSRSRDFQDLPPEVHYTLWRRLVATGKAEDARREADTVIASVQDRLGVEEKVSMLRAFVEIVNPFMRPDYTKRFLNEREIGQAADVMRQTGRASEATRLYEVQIRRSPGSQTPRLNLAAALIDEGQALARQAQTYRDNKDMDQAAKADQEAKARFRAAEKQIAAVQRLNPTSSDAIALRVRLSAVTGTTPAP